MDLRRFVLDVHPDKINPRRDDEPRNPGKFDHRVHQEQSLFCGTRLTNERKKLSIERELVAEHIDRDILKTREKARCLKKLTREHKFLHKLRDIINELPESARDWEVKKLPYGSYEAGVASCKHEPAQSELVPAPEPAQNRAAVADLAATDVVATADEIPNQSGAASLVDKCRLLAKMKKDISQSVLPPVKLRRILPEKSDSVSDAWPIMSNYRRQRVLPSVNQQKLEELTDRATLRQRVNVYFGAAVPLQFPPLAQPPPSEEQQLLNALRGARG